MSFLTKFGTTYGQTPHTTGRLFFVAPSAEYSVDGRTYNASDNNDGLAPDRALRTINQAVTNATANVGDVIYLLRGTHTVTATQRLTKAGLTVLGEHSPHYLGNRYQPKTILTSTGTSVPLLTVEAANTEIGFLDLRPTTVYSAVIFPTGDAALDGVYIHDCHFDLETPAASVGTIGIDLGYRNATLTFQGNSDAKHGQTTSVVSSILVEDCVFESDGAQGAAINWATAFGTVSRCHFWSSAGTWATAFRVATATDNLLITDCVWSSTGTITVSIDGTFADVAGGCVIQRCTFNNFGTSNVNSVDAIRGFGAGEVQVTDCYAGSIANGTTSATAISRMTG